MLTERRSSSYTTVARDGLLSRGWDQAFQSATARSLSLIYSGTCRAPLRPYILVPLRSAALSTFGYPSLLLDCAHSCEDRIIAQSSPVVTDSPSWRSAPVLPLLYAYDFRKTRFSPSQAGRTGKAFRTRKGFYRRRSRPRKRCRSTSSWVNFPREGRSNLPWARNT